MQSDNPTAAILVIGDEILSGRTREGNAHHLAQVLTATGFDLREIRVVSDDHDSIVGAIREYDKSLGGKYDLLFTSGGIGPTHDDITADAVADAHGTTVEIHPDARAILQEITADAVADAHGTTVEIHPDARAILQERCDRMGTELTENRLRMARIPVGATLIDNSVSGAPGFSIGCTHVMAGVPEVFRGMVAWLVPNLPGGRPVQSLTIEVRRGESDVAEDLKAVAADFADLSLGSYPFRDDTGWGTNLVVRGLDQARVAAGMSALKARLSL